MLEEQQPKALANKKAPHSADVFAHVNGAQLFQERTQKRVVAAVMTVAVNLAGTFRVVLENRLVYSVELQAIAFVFPF